MQRYLRAFAAWYGLHRAVRCNTRVVSARPVLNQPGHVQQQQQQLPDRVKWILEIETRATGPGAEAAHCPQHVQQQQQQASLEQQEFDAVVVANGHYTEPNLPEVPGMASSPVLQMHSHNYRTPDRFKGQVWAATPSRSMLCVRLAGEGVRCPHMSRGAGLVHARAPPKASPETGGTGAFQICSGGRNVVALLSP